MAYAFCCFVCYVVVVFFFIMPGINSLWTRDAMWWHKSWLILAWVMACSPLGLKPLPMPNADLSLIRLCGIHMRTISHWVSNLLFYIMSFEKMSHQIISNYVYFYKIYCHVGMNYSYCIGQCCWYYTVFEMLHKHLTCLTLFTNIMLIICYFPGNFLAVIHCVQIENRGIKSPPPWRWNVEDVGETFSDILWEQFVQYVAEACI